MKIGWRSHARRIVRMANRFALTHNCRQTSVGCSQCLWEQLFVAIFLMLLTVLAAVLSAITNAIDSWSPRWLKWRRTSLKELKEVDQRILESLPCVQDQRFVGLGNNNVLWSVTCNPQGSGTPLVLVHGMGGGVGLWAMNLEALSQHRPVYAFDLLGFGRSSRPTFPSDAQEVEDIFVEAIENYRIAMGLDHFILVGHSLGGFLSASYALRYPQYIKHLVLADPWGINPQPCGGSRQIPFLIRLLASVLKIGYPLSILRALGPLGPLLVKRYRPGLAKIFGAKLGDVSLLHKYIYHCNAQNPSGEVGFTSMSWNFAWAKDPMIHRLQALDPDIPITFVYGACSWVNRATGWNIKNSREGYVDVQILRGAGHHVYADRWDLFNTLVETLAISVDNDALPDFDSKLVKRIHAAPSTAYFQIPNPSDLDFQRPLDHEDENLSQGNAPEPDREGSEVREEEEDSHCVPTFSLPDSR